MAWIPWRTKPSPHPIQLPTDLSVSTITTMTPGEHGYTNPKAVLVSIDRMMWINGAYAVVPEPDDLNKLRIMRTDEGVKVDRRRVPAQRPEGRPAFASIYPWNQLPIVGFIDEEQ